MGRRLNQLPIKNSLDPTDLLIGHDGSAGFQVAVADALVDGGINHTHTQLAACDITNLRIAVGNGTFVRLVPIVEGGKASIAFELE